MHGISAAQGHRPFRISVIVPTNNRISLARPVFSALSRETKVDGDVSVIVVDQGSTDAVDALAASFGFTVVRSSSPTAGGLRNYGVRTTDAEYIVFIDSDVLIPEGYFNRLRSAIESYPNDIIGCNYGLPESPTWTERNWFDLTFQYGTGERNWLNAGNMAMSRSTFDSLSGFDPTLSSGEDTDLCERFLRRGGSVRQIETLTAAHLGNPKTLSAFVKKQIWHGQGAPLANANSVASIAHLILLTLGLIALGAGTTMTQVAGGFVAVNTIPVAAYLHLARRKGSLPSFPQSIANLHAYFLGRFVALVYRSNKQR
jgi:GT2 family glycosyltransferase